MKQSVVKMSQISFLSMNLLKIFYFKKNSTNIFICKKTKIKCMQRKGRIVGVKKS
jgi:hypothetical protein